MEIADLIRARDGSMSQTKLAAACAHFSMFVTVNMITIKTMEFNEAMWTLYIGVAIVHSFGDKAMASFKEFKEKKLEAETGGTPGVAPVNP